MDERIKSTFLVCLTCLALGFAVGILKYQEEQNALPTPVPAHWKPVSIGTIPKLPVSLLRMITSAPAHPVLLNFYNPDCPCSRFNLRHVRSLAWRYGKQFTFVAVLQGSDPARLEEQFQQTGVPIASIIDADGEIARACGVISTPQAALLDTDRRLYFRGNYNAARYCSGTRTEFARLAMEALLSRKPCPAFPPSATIAYGCALPTGGLKQAPQ